MNSESRNKRVWSIHKSSCFSHLWLFGIRERGSCYSIILSYYMSKYCSINLCVALPLALHPNNCRDLPPSWHSLLPRAEVSSHLSAHDRRNPAALSPSAPHRWGLQPSLVQSGSNWSSTPPIGREWSSLLRGTVWGGTKKNGRSHVQVMTLLNMDNHFSTGYPITKWNCLVSHTPDVWRCHLWHARLDTAISA